MENTAGVKVVSEVLFLDFLETGPYITFLVWHDTIVGIYIMCGYNWCEIERLL